MGPVGRKSKDWILVWQLLLYIIYPGRKTVLVCCLLAHYLYAENTRCICLQQLFWNRQRLISRRTADNESMLALSWLDEHHGRGLFHVFWFPSWPHTCCVETELRGRQQVFLLVCLSLWTRLYHHRAGHRVNPADSAGPAFWLPLVIDWSHN